MQRSWTTVRVFISSTFRDMQAERDHLVKVVFPALREKLEPYRVHLIDIDLRWGVTRQQAENNQAVGLCLDQIDECRPFFLGLLGERYGWVPDEVPPQVSRHRPWLRALADRSITELEFLHGALNGPLGGSRALFCLRDPDATATIPEPVRSALFVETDPETAHRLAALKQRVRTSSLSVLDGYTCAWRPGPGRLAGLEAFGEQVRDWLWDAIRDQLGLPDQLNTDAAESDWTVEETEHHERFLESRLHVFSGRSGAISSLMDFVSSDDGVPCLAAGPNGCGKTALLARFTEVCRQELPEAVVLPHFTGAGPRSTSLRDLLRRLGQSLQQRFDLDEEPLDTTDRISEQFRDLLWRIPATARVVLVLDGLDRLDDTDQAHELYWLPDRLPPHVKVVAACASGTPVFGAFGRLAPRLIEVGPLSDRERLAILRRLPSLSAKSLDRRQVRALLDNPATRNPLFLTAALEELRGFGLFEHLDQRIAALPAGENPTAELFAQLLERLEADFGRELVQSILGLLSVSRRGLTEGEMLGLTAMLPDHDNLFPMLRQLRPWLLDRGGRTDLAPRDLRDAVQRRYLGTDTDRRDAHRTLADFFASQPLGERKVEELPWHLSRAGEWARLRDLLADLPFFDAAWQAGAFEVKAYWARIESATSLRLTAAYRSVVERPAEHTPETLARVALLLADTGHTTEALVLRRHLLDHHRRLGDPIGLAAALGNLALLHKCLGENDDALSLYAEAESLCREHGDRQGLQRVLGNRARLMKALGDLDGAMRLLQEQEQICREIGNRQGLQMSLGNQALVLQARADVAGALRLLAERERICRESGNRHGLQIALNSQGLLLQQLGNAEAALARLHEAEAICRDLGNRQGLQIALGHRATILGSRGEYEEAAKLFAEQERLCRQMSNRLGLQIALGNRAMLRAAVGDTDAALALLAEAEGLARQLRSPEAVIATLRNQAAVLLRAGRGAEARTRAEEALGVANAHRLTAMAAWVQSLLETLNNPPSSALEECGFSAKRNELLTP